MLILKPKVFLTADIPLKEGIGYISLPYPMTKESFDLVLKTFKKWKKGLVKTNIENATEKPERA